MRPPNGRQRVADQTSRHTNHHGTPPHPPAHKLVHNPRESVASALGHSDQQHVSTDPARIGVAYARARAERPGRETRIRRRPRLALACVLATSRLAPLIAAGLQRTKLRCCNWCDAATMSAPTLAAGAAATGQPQPRDLPTPPWLLCATGGTPEPAQATDAKVANSNFSACTAAAVRAIAFPSESSQVA